MPNIHSSAVLIIAERGSEGGKLGYTYTSENKQRELRFALPLANLLMSLKAF